MYDVFSSKPAIVPTLPAESTAQVMFPVTVTELLAPTFDPWVKPVPPICKLRLNVALLMVIDWAVQSSVIVVPGFRVTVMLLIMVVVVCARTTGGASKMTSATDPDELSKGGCVCG